MVTSRLFEVGQIPGDATFVLIEVSDLTTAGVIVGDDESVCCDTADARPEVRVGVQRSIEVNVVDFVKCIELDEAELGRQSFHPLEWLAADTHDDVYLTFIEHLHELVFGVGNQYL